MIAGILVILALLHILDWMLKQMGFFKPKNLSKSFDFDNDVLNPLGYTSDFYLKKSDLMCVLKVRQKLNEFYYRADQGSAKSTIEHHINTNIMLEEFCLEDLKKQTI